MALATLVLGGLTSALALVRWRYRENRTVSIATVLAAVLMVAVPTVT